MGSFTLDKKIADGDLDDQWWLATASLDKKKFILQQLSSKLSYQGGFIKEIENLTKNPQVKVNVENARGIHSNEAGGARVLTLEFKLPAPDVASTAGNLSEPDDFIYRTKCVAKALQEIHTTREALNGKWSTDNTFITPSGKAYFLGTDTHSIIDEWMRKDGAQASPNAEKNDDTEIAADIKRFGESFLALAKRNKILVPDAFHKSLTDCEKGDPDALQKITNDDFSDKNSEDLIEKLLNLPVAQRFHQNQKNNCNRMHTNQNSRPPEPPQTTLVCPQTKE
ncbi:MAG: hypothetical protein AAF226_07660 [Verrucomicrobiota bacterium]